MVRGSRGNRGRGRSGGNGQTPTGNPQLSSTLPSQLDRHPTTSNPTNPSADDHCATCNQIVGDDCIGCDRCTNWFCPSGMCLGLPDELVRGITQFGGDAIAYICTECRCTSPASGPDNPAFKQPLQTVKKLCETLHTLSSKVERLTSPPSLPQSSASPANPTTDPANNTDDNARRLIRDEIHEMNERQKRVNSLIVRDIDAPDNSVFKQHFTTVARYLLENPVDFTDLKCINRERKFYRLNVPNI
ncbi:hypothetical protein E2C01_098797 [Portunus trituberculatus]|uniref:4Fe-4S ferredoxin-type domain-containing protein n=1 Tax=Portunus trituberculatus TaxID=210409 RepID=A0A5B7JYP8_PORTR|nr:hypothetical protein [Portunus trituberculatus]